MCRWKQFLFGWHFLKTPSLHAELSIQALTLSACRNGACDWHDISTGQKEKKNYQTGSEEKWAVLLRIAVKMHFGNCGVYGPFPACLVIGFLRPETSHVRENSLWNLCLKDVGEQNNIATPENNTTLRHCFSSDPRLNKRSSQSGFYVMNNTRPIPFRQVSRLGNGFSARFCSELYKDLPKKKYWEV